MYFYADGKSKILEVELAAVVLAEEEMLDFPVDVPLCLESEQPAMDEVEGEMYNPVFEEFAQIYFVVLHFFGDLFEGVQTGDLQEGLQVLFYWLSFVSADKFYVLDEAALQKVQAVFENIFAPFFHWINIGGVTIGTLFTSGPGPHFGVSASFVPFAGSLVNELTIIGGIERVKFALGQEEMFLLFEKVESEVTSADYIADFLELHPINLHIGNLL